MADALPTMNPAEMIAEQSAALSEKLGGVARQAVLDALAAGAIATAADVLAALEGVTATLPVGLAAALEAELPKIAAQAVVAAEVEIADARAESGKPYPDVVPPPAGNYGAWALTSITALITGLKKKAEAAAPAPTATAEGLSAEVEAELDRDISAALDELFGTAAARSVNSARMAVFSSNSDIVKKVEVVTVHDAKRSQICTDLSGAQFDPSRPVPTPPYHNGCRSYLAAVTTAKRKAGATDAEIYRQNWAIFRRLEREAKAQAEGRSAPVEFRFSPGGVGEFEGYAMVWNTMDNHRTSFAPGSLNLPESGIPLLFNHDPGQPVGRVTETRVDQHGLFIKGRLTLSTSAGSEAFALVRDKALTGLSVGFKRTSDEPTAGGRRITAADLKEISLVALPSNESARITEVRAAPAGPDAASTKEKAKMADGNTPAPGEGDINARVTALEGKVDGIAKKVDEIAGGVKAAEQRADRIEARSARTGLGRAAEAPSGIEIEHRAIAAFARGDERPMLELRAGMSVGSDPDGGYVVMPQLSSNMTKKLFDATPMRRLCRVETITQGDAWVEPIDADDVGAEWVGEAQARVDTDSPDLGLLTVPLREIYAKVPVTQRLLDDAGIDLGQWLEGKMTDKFVRSEGAAFISSTTTPKRPAGLLSYPTAATADAARAWSTVQFVKSGDASKITADGLKNLVWSLRAPYRDGAVFLMNSNTANALDTLVDSEGRYLWRASMLAGSPNSLLGYPVEFSEDMPDVGAGAFPIAFGNFKRAYLIVDKLGTRFIRDPYSDKPNTLFYAYRRVGGGLANSEAVKLQKISA